MSYVDAKQVRINRPQPRSNRPTLAVLSMIAAFLAASVIAFAMLGGHSISLVGLIALLNLSFWLRQVCFQFEADDASNNDHGQIKG